MTRGIYRFLNSAVLLLLFLMIFSLFACEKKSNYQPTYTESNSNKKVLIVGCADPSHYDAVDLLAKNLNKKLKNVQLKILAGSSFSDHIVKLKQRKFDIVFTNGLVGLDAKKSGYDIVAKFGNDDSYYSVLFTRKNSDIRQFENLRGKKIAMVAKGSILGDILPVMFLQKNGINVKKDMKSTYVPTFESSILNVYLDKYDVGICWVRAWNRYMTTHPEISKKLEIKWRTPNQKNIAIIFKEDIDQAIKTELLNLLFAINKDKQGKYALTEMGYDFVEKADSTTYNSLVKLKYEFDKLEKSQ